MPQFGTHDLLIVPLPSSSLAFCLGESCPNFDKCGCPKRGAEFVAAWTFGVLRFDSPATSGVPLISRAIFAYSGTHRACIANACECLEESLTMRGGRGPGGIGHRRSSFRVIIYLLQNIIYCA